MVLTMNVSDRLFGKDYIRKGKSAHLLEILPKSQGFFNRLSFSQNLQNQAKEGRTKAAASTVQKIA